MNQGLARNMHGPWANPLYLQSLHPFSDVAPLLEYRPSAFEVLDERPVRLEIISLDPESGDD